MQEQLFGTSIGLLTLMGLVLTIVVGLWVATYVVAKVLESEGGDDAAGNRDVP